MRYSPVGYLLRVFPRHLKEGDRGTTSVTTRNARRSNPLQTSNATSDGGVFFVRYSPAFMLPSLREVQQRGKLKKYSEWRFMASLKHTIPFGFTHSLKHKQKNARSKTSHLLLLGGRWCFYTISKNLSTSIYRPFCPLFLPIWSQCGHRKYCLISAKVIVISNSANYTQ